MGFGLAVAVGLLAFSRLGLQMPPSAASGLMLEFVAVLAGGFVAARLAGRIGVAHGLAVAVGFIVGATAIQGWSEMELAASHGPDVVEPLNLGALIVADLVHLSAGCLGGWLARSGGMPVRQR